ncbi:UNVERIFIED_CONTAM: FHIPEP family type III secretion protein, partial [Salmonella enterica subsp. enterica serovar Weltevreden]
LAVGEAVKTYTLLTIGDGLVAQIPALLLSVAVAVLVTRMSRSEDMTQQMKSQVFGEPKALGLAAAMLGLIGLIPGMPNLMFLTLASACAGLARLISQRQ